MCDAALNLPEKRDYVARGIVTKDLLASGPFGDLIPELIAISTKQLNACCDVLRGDDDPVPATRCWFRSSSMGFDAEVGSLASHSCKSSFVWIAIAGTNC